MLRSKSKMFFPYFFMLCAVCMASVPKEINHQGVVSVNGTAFDGTGLFRFAIVDTDTGTNLWTNDGTIVGAIGGIPAAAVSLNVSKGVYSVSLGDTGLTNMTEIASSVFNSSNTVLRIWFDDGVNGLQQLTPDHKLTTAPYSFRLPNITVDDSGNVGIGTTSPVGEFHITAPSDESTLAVLETTGPVPLTGATLQFYRSGVFQKGIGINGNDDFELWQGTGSNDSPTNRMFMRMIKATGNTFFGGNVGIRTLPVNAILNVGSASFTSSIRVDANTNSGQVPLVHFLSTVHDNSDVLFRITGDSDGDAGGPWTGLEVQAGGAVVGRFGSYHVASDKRLKHNIVTVPNALERVLALRGVNFKWKDTNLDGDAVQMGLIAQEVEKVFPEVVHTADDKMKTKAVEYERLVGALIEAIKELDAIVKQKDSELTTQRKRIASFESRLAAIEARLPKLAQADRRD